MSFSNDFYRQYTELRMEQPYDPTSKLTETKKTYIKLIEKSQIIFKKNRN